MFSVTALLPFCDLQGKNTQNKLTIFHLLKHLMAFKTIFVGYTGISITNKDGRGQSVQFYAALATIIVT